ncbi:MAG: hypothetical protein WDZ42_00715 [Candidatus Saccharimonadales bacterium]
MSSNFSLPENVVTKRDVRLAIRQIEKLIEDDKDISSLSEPAKSIVNINSDIVDSKGVNEIIKESRLFLKRAPLFDLILADYPYDSFTQDIGAWFRDNIDPESLIDISVRRGIGGGAILISKNKIFDMSFRLQLLESRDKIPEVLRRV